MDSRSSNKVVVIQPQIFTAARWTLPRLSSRLGARHPPGTRHALNTFVQTCFYVVRIELNNCSLVVLTLNCGPSAAAV